MSNITIIDKNYPNAKDEGWRVVIAGDLIVEGGLDIRCNLFVTGCIKAGWGIKAGSGIEAGSDIKAGWGIKAGSGIKAGLGIEAGWGINAGSGIEAGLGVKAGSGIEAGEDIKAGWGIKAKTISSKLRIFAGLCLWRLPTAEEKQIRCEELLSGTIEYGELVITKPKPPEFIEQYGYKYKLVEAE